MDEHHFDRLTRIISTRRIFGLGICAAALFGLTDAATARRRKKPNCKKFAIKPPRCDGTFCSKTRIRTCAPKYHRCYCREGTVCLRNGNCGLSCAEGCPESCFCATGDQAICLQAPYVCAEIPPCSSTADCPSRTACTVTECGPGATTEKRCVPLCDMTVSE